MLLSITHPVNINVIGMGGTGTALVKELARMNYALMDLNHPGIHVCAYDPSEVRKANLGRQLFLKEDIGINKAVAMISRINLAWGTKWEAEPKSYEGVKQDGSKTFTVLCTDTASSRKKIINDLISDGFRYSSHIVNSAVYLIDCGNDQHFGQVILNTIVPSKNTSTKFNVIEEMPYDDRWANINNDTQGESCSLATALGKQDLMVNTMAAQIACQMIWQLIYKKSIDYKGVYYNLQTMNMRSVPL